ncbi:MAG: tripartite tricarboxylate transporter substrate binding protein [Synergistetes bacterium]|nr:tripartite tricarboxylate transporter substrate binding protein [Synergistota bacterium]
MRKVLLLVLLMVFSLSAGLAWAAYPSKPITVIVAFKAGGGTDTMARLVAKFAEKYLGQPIVVINKPGAGGQIGFEALARARKDGYTIGCINTPHLLGHIVAGRAHYKLSDFWPIANGVTDPGVLVVRSDSPVKTLEDFIALAKKKKGELSVATTGPGGDDFIAMMLFSEAAGIKLKEVPCSGSSEQKAVLMGGHVDAAFMNVSQVWSQVQAGKLRWIAVMTKKRLPYLPDLPTFWEKGYKVISDSSRGFAAPAGIPKEAYKKLVGVFYKVFHDKEFIAAAKKSRLLLNYMGPEQYKKYLEEQLKAVKKVYDKHPW